ncbi:MAG: zinc-ribbon domain-containing protein [Acidobacteriota bacterium]
MQAQCPECSTRFQLPDEKVPDRPFKVRCPKCQHVVDLPGRGEAPPAPPEELKPAVPITPPSPPRREHTGSENAEDALIALADTGLAKTLTGVLGRLDYNVDVVGDVEEGARLLEQGAYALAVTSSNSAKPGGPMTLAQRMLRLTPDPRRRVFVVLVSEDFATADGTQAWAAQADLVVNPRDAEVCENVIRSTLAERKRLFQPYLDARRRIETD